MKGEETETLGLRKPLSSGQDLLAMKRYQKQSVRMMWLVNLGLILALVYVAKTLVTPHPTEEPSVGSKTGFSTDRGVKEKALPALHDVNNTLILERNIFGEGPQGNQKVLKTPAGSKHKISQLALAQLGIKLLGTVAGDQAVSFAVLEDSKTGQQDIYRIGDTIQEARLEEILPNRVVVVFQGEHCTLDVALTDGRTMPEDGVVAQSTEQPVPAPAQSRDVLKMTSPSKRMVNTVVSGNSIQRFEYGLRGLALEPNLEGPGSLKATSMLRMPVARLAGLKDDTKLRFDFPSSDSWDVDKFPWFGARSQGYTMGTPVGEDGFAENWKTTFPDVLRGEAAPMASRSFWQNSGSEHQRGEEMLLGNQKGLLEQLDYDYGRRQQLDPPGACGFYLSIPVP